MRNASLIRRFHEAAGLPVELEATIPPDEVRYLRRSLAFSSTVELVVALGPDGKVPEVAKELADVLVVAYGTAEAYGIDLDKAFEIVMEANLRKIPDCPDCEGSGYLSSGPGRLFKGCGYCGTTGKAAPLRREDGKILKPEGWDPPDLQWALRRRRRAPKDVPELPRNVGVGVDPETGAEKLMELPDDAA